MDKRIAVLTTIRGEDFFLEKWIEYYGAQFGRKNLYVIVDGHDQDLPDDIRDVNFIHIPHVPAQIVAFEKRRARLISGIASGLSKTKSGSSSILWRVFGQSLQTRFRSGHCCECVCFSGFLEARQDQMIPAIYIKSKTTSVIHG